MMNFVLLIVFSIFSYNVAGEFKLKQVQLVYRHGDRAPTSIYPTDINQANKWPYGLGQLTKLGVRQQYKLGIWLRKQYNEFVGQTLNNSDIHVRSTNNDRTLMSAQANLAGFVFSDKYQIIKGLPWHPVAVHTKPEDIDFLLEDNTCPRYGKEMEALYQTDVFKKRLAPYVPTLELVRQKSGITNLTFSDIWKIYDTLFCEKTHNMTVDDWVTTNVWKDMVLINQINWEIMYYKGLAKLAGGLLLYKLTDNMKQIATKSTVGGGRVTKIMEYSGHDTDVAPLAQLLGFYDNEQPPYAACIILELYHDTLGSDQWAVKVLYKNDSNSDGEGHSHAMIIPGCNSTLCPLSLFIEVTKKNAMSKKEFLSECALRVDMYSFVEAILALLCAIMLFCVILMVVFRIRRKRETVKYSRCGGEKSVN